MCLDKNRHRTYREAQIVNKLFTTLRPEYCGGNNKVSHESGLFCYDGLMIQYNFCYQCSKPLNITDEVPSCPQHGPLWPLHRNAICGDALVVNEHGQILLGKRNTPPYVGWWGFLGGFTDYGEHPRDAAVREVLEETGWEVEVVMLVGIYIESLPCDENSEHRVSATYLMRPIKEVEGIIPDTPDFAWFQLDDLPKQIPKSHLKRIRDI